MEASENYGLIFSIDFKRVYNVHILHVLCTRGSLSFMFRHIARIEKGSPTVSIGIYARVLYALQLDDDLLLIAKEDTLGRNLQDLSLKHRQRASKKE
ncbi:MAG: hypothetical protein NC095_09530 [Muribaculum sp.]|nr:hypothetical protein [Muribaculum sp.]